MKKGGRDECSPPVAAVSLGLPREAISLRAVVAQVTHFRVDDVLRHKITERRPI